MEIKTESPKLALSKKITTKKAIIGVIGLGYVGLPLALEITNKDFRVIGFDKDYRKIDKLKAGQSYIVDLPSSVIHKAVSEDGFVPTNDFSKLSHADVIVICVPTPTTADGAPNISYIEEATTAIQQNLSSNTLIILESTTYPGTTEQIVQPILEKKQFCHRAGYIFSLFT